MRPESGSARIGSHTSGQHRSSYRFMKDRAEPCCPRGQLLDDRANWPVTARPAHQGEPVDRGAACRPVPGVGELGLQKQVGAGDNSRTIGAVDWPYRLARNHAQIASSVCEACGLPSRMCVQKIGDGAILTTKDAEVHREDLELSVPPVFCG